MSLQWTFHSAINTLSKYRNNSVSSQPVECNIEYFTTIKAVVCV